MVIQRWQSVLLLVAAVVMGLASFLPLAEIQAQTATYIFSALGIETAGEMAPAGTVAVESNIFLFLISIVGAILPLIDIFLFKNLPLQKRVCLISLLFSIAICVSVPVMVYQFAGGSQVNWLQMACAPIIAVVAEVMAWQRINSDYRKINNDRLI